MRAIVQKLKSFGTRIVLGSPGCIGRVPAWESVAEAGSTLDGINTSLLYVREEAALIAEEEGLPFVDHFCNLYRARLDGLDRYCCDYAVCGVYDGVHPSW